MAVSTALAALPPVADAVLKGDRDGLSAILGDASKALKTQGMPLMNLILPPATIFLRVHDPKAFGDDISSRRAAVVTTNGSAKPVVGVEQGRDTLGIFAITPIVRDGKSIAAFDVGAVFGKEFVDHAKQRFGVDLAVHWYDGKSSKTLSSTFGDHVVATEGELKSVLDGATLQRDANLDGHPAALYVGQIRNYAGAAGRSTGSRQGHHRIRGRDREFAAQSDDRHGRYSFRCGLGGFLLGRGLSRPLAAITAVMNRLSSGDTAVTIPGGNRKDELGTMAATVDVFRRNMIEANSLREITGRRQAASRSRKESAAAPDGRSLRGRRQERGRRRSRKQPGTCSASP